MAAPALEVLLDPEHPGAKLPEKGSQWAAGYDLFASEKTVLKPWSRGIVKTGIRINCPPGTYARIAPRSGLSVKKKLDCGAGVVDRDYRGLVGVVLINSSPDEVTIEQGDRCAQLILERYEENACVKQVSSLSETQRGAGGFGSTGVQGGVRQENIPDNAGLAPPAKMAA